MDESLVAILGEENAQRVLELMDKFGDECEEFVRRFLSELIQAKEEMVDAQEKIDDLLRKLYGQTRERFVDPNQMELFEDLAPGMPPVQEPVQEEEKEIKVAYSRKKPRRRFGGRNQDLPTKTIVMDPEGEWSHLKKIGEEVHRVFHDQPARIFVYE